jgi:hypothetical protein
MMNTSRRHLRLVLKCVAAAAISTALSSTLALKTDMYAIGDWSGGNCAAGDVDTDRGAWPGMASAWYNQMGAMGHWRTGNFTNGDMTVRRFCDPTVNAACQDFFYVDWPDAAIVAAHGFDAGGGWGALMRNRALGTCSTVMGTPGGGNVKVGDSNLKFLNASSCLSLNDSYFANMRAAMRKAGSAKGLHVMTGFHGVMWISGAYNGDYSNAAFRGHIMPVSTAWVTSHYKSNQFSCAAWDPFNWFGTCQDQCPTAMTIGASGAEALNRLLHERYNAVMPSPSGNGWYAWMGYAGCDPVAAGPFSP